MGKKRWFQARGNPEEWAVDKTVIHADSKVSSLGLYLYLRSEHLNV